MLGVLRERRRLAARLEVAALALIGSLAEPTEAVVCSVDDGGGFVRRCP